MGDSRRASCYSVPKLCRCLPASERVVAQHRSKRAGRVPSAGGALARLALARAQAEGRKLDPLLKSAGLTRQQLSNRKTWIPARNQIKFVNLVADVLEDDCLGFHLAQDFDLCEIGLFYYVMASSDTVAEALQRASRYAAIV